MNPETLTPEMLLERPCACHSPAFARIAHGMAAGLTRRGLGRSIAAAAAASTVLTCEAFAEVTDKPIRFTNVRIFDGRSSQLIDGRDVLVSGGKIEALVPRTEQVAVAEVLDGGGGVLMPGLVDAHWHSMLVAIPQSVAMTADLGYIHLLAGQEAERTLLRGFTTVRDVGGPSFALKRAIDEHRLAGPRIYPSGAMISQTGGHGDFRMRYEIPRSPQTSLSRAEEAGVSALADGEAEVLQRVREQLLLGASQIKIMAGGGVSSLYDPIDGMQFTPAEIRAAVAAASDWGTYVCAHVYTSAGVQRAIENGVRSIEHGQLADEATVRRIVDTDTWWSIQPFLMDEDANPKSTPEQQRQQRLIAEGTVRAFELGKKHRAKMVWGTDILFDASKAQTQGKQLAKLARWFEPAEVLRMATSRSGELLALSGERNPYPGALGVITPGAWADILVVAGNPLDDLGLLARPEETLTTIMKEGRIIKRNPPQSV